MIICPSKNIHAFSEPSLHSSFLSGCPKSSNFNFLPQIGYYFISHLKLKASKIKITTHYKTITLLAHGLNTLRLRNTLQAKGSILAGPGIQAPFPSLISAYGLFRRKTDIHIMPIGTQRRDGHY
jgi:hypothetical protein